MKLEIKELRKADDRQAINFAVKGMHFDWYMNSQWLLNLYGRYFWYLELTRATQIIAAYSEDTLLGVLLAEIEGEPKQCRSFWKSAYVKIFDLLQSLFVKGGAGVYNNANKELFSNYCQRNNPDGEIVFFAVNPAVKAKGIGSLLLQEFERRETGKKIYLYTDNACTYQFYEHKGFDRVGEKDIVLHIGSRRVNLKCFLYSKVIA